MTTTRTALRNSRGARRALAGAALVLTGATLAAVAAAVLPGAPTAEARIPNYVRSVNPDAISRVLLDEDVVIEFNTAVLGSSIGPDTILVRTGPTNGEQARGTYVVGSFLYDRSVQRRVVIRPEAVQEYYELVQGKPRADAARAATNLIRRVEATGSVALLRTVDTQLRIKLGALAGTRLDDSNVYAIYPSQLIDTTPNDNDDPLTLDAGDDPLEPYRTRIAGDDALWQSYLGGDVNAFAQLAQNSEYERFYHPVDPATGVPSTNSVLRQREYRRVLIDRRNGARVMFVPDIPIRTDIADTGFTPGRAYAIIIPASAPGVFNTVLTRDHSHPLQQTNGHDFSTLFTTVPATSTQLFRAAETYTGVSLLQKPRIINQTPPNGELFIDSTTDWEDPDNQFTVPIPQRKTFSVRMRFAQPLDPRTVTPTTFTVTKVATLDAAGHDVAGVNVPVAIGTFLNQHRLGIVEVEVTPATNLDPQSRYQVVARSLVHSLAGAANAIDYVGSFTVGAGQPPITSVKENFTNATNRADPLNPDTATQITSAYWPAPALYDTTSSGKLVAAFMQFAGTGVGAPSVPTTPSSPITLSLNLGAGQQITFLTENVNPANPTTLGTPIEYNYTDVVFTNAQANAIGRFPLVIRSQNTITLTSSQILLAGLSGGPGLTNAAGGTDPTGGLGGGPGPAGYRGGDGGCAPLTDASGTPILGAGGNLQFDPNKFNGSDGAPSYLPSSSPLSLGGGGSGGFSGDAEAPNNVDCYIDTQSPNPAISIKDRQCTPARFRECGGGGGHATAGGNGDGARGSGKTKTGGYYGGLGGTTYGKADFSDQEMNGLFGTFGAPRLTFGSGGAGGGGGGAEDNTSTSNSAADGVADAGDAGGGGGGGGGGAIQLVARTQILLVSSVIDCSGGPGGRTFNAAKGDYGRGAPGGCGAGGSIWMQCYGSIDILNGSKVTAAGGDNSQSLGYYQVNQINTEILGAGGRGGDGYVRFEDNDSTSPGQANVVGSTVLGSVAQAVFAPYDNPSTTLIEADYKAFPGKPFVVNFSQGFSVWFNTGLDTPTFAPHDDDPSTSAIDGTSVFAPTIGTTPSLVQIWVRTAPNDTANTGHPNLFLATSSGNVAPWTAYADVATISRRRFLQFRVDFTVPLSYTFNLAQLPYVDFVQIDINLN